MPEKQKGIAKVREIVSEVLSFDDTAEVFNCIEEELGYYKQEGCRIDQSKKRVNELVDNT